MCKMTQHFSLVFFVIVALHEARKSGSRDREFSYSRQLELRNVWCRYRQLLHSTTKSGVQCLFSLLTAMSPSLVSPLETESYVLVNVQEIRGPKDVPKFVSHGLPSSKRPTSRPGHPSRIRTCRLFLSALGTRSRHSGATHDTWLNWC